MDSTISVAGGARDEVYLVAFRIATTVIGSLEHNRALTALAGLVLERGQHPTQEAQQEAVEDVLARAGRSR